MVALLQVRLAVQAETNPPETGDFVVSLGAPVPEGFAGIELSLSSEQFGGQDDLAALRTALSHQPVGPGLVRERPSSLTMREAQVAGLIAQGFSNEEICARLGLQAQSVRNLVSSLLKKLNCDNRIQVALLYSGRAESPA